MRNSRFIFRFSFTLDRDSRSDNDDDKGSDGDNCDISAGEGGRGAGEISPEVGAPDHLAEMLVDEVIAKDPGGCSPGIPVRVKQFLMHFFGVIQRRMAASLGAAGVDQAERVFVVCFCFGLYSSDVFFAGRGPEAFLHDLVK